MFGLDEWIGRLGGSGLMVFVVAILLGLRHATDPDHLTAVSTLFLTDGRDGPRKATVSGQVQAWSGVRRRQPAVQCLVFPRGAPRSI